MSQSQADLEEPRPVSPPFMDYPVICQVCGMRQRPGAGILCERCGEPVLIGGWAP
jgi:hypothetical protein